MLETVIISGVNAPLKSFSHSRSAEEAVRTATASFAWTGSGLPNWPDDPVTISANGTLLLTGYVRDVNPSYSDGPDRELSMTFVSKTVDCVECSVDHPTGEVLNKNLADVAREFDTYGVGVEDDGGLPVEPKHKLIPGESQFDTIERRARGRGVLIHDTPEGKLKLATKPAGRHAGTLRRGEGGNIKSGSANFTGKDRYSEVKVRGQATVGSKAAQLRGQAVAEDGGVSRRRVLIARHEGEMTTDRMKSRAEWHVRRGAGMAATATITTIGWRDDGGAIWTENYLVQVEDDLLAISGVMVIKSVTLNQDPDGGGTTATLSLADPRALGGENPRGGSAGGYAAATPKARFEEE
jgi:prophage tail gpP-like protein